MMLIADTTVLSKCHEGLLIFLRLREIEPSSASEILDIDEILDKPLNDPVRIGTIAEHALRFADGQHRQT
jgi:hypothetical protein